MKLFRNYLLGVFIGLLWLPLSSVGDTRDWLTCVDSQLYKCYEIHSMTQSAQVYHFLSDSTEQNYIKVSSDNYNYGYDCDTDTIMLGRMCLDLLSKGGVKYQPYVHPRVATE